MFEAKLAAEFVNHHEFQCSYVDKISVNFQFPIDEEIYYDYISLKLHWYNNTFWKTMNVFWIEFPGYFWLA